MNIEDIKTKYMADAVKTGAKTAAKNKNEDAIQKADALWPKIKPLAESVNLAEFKYNEAARNAVTEFNKIIEPYDRAVKAEAKMIFRRWCRTKVKGI